jgi:hypothetical protein
MGQLSYVETSGSRSRHHCLGGVSYAVRGAGLLRRGRRAVRRDGIRIDPDIRSAGAIGGPHGGGGRR